MTRSALTALAAALVCAVPGVATAQDRAPRVMVIFDTSGSMLWNPEDTTNCQGDGSAEYPHLLCEEPADGSKLWFAKGALATVIEDAPTVQFGLMRYGQLEPGDAGYGSPIHTDPNRSAQYYSGGQVVATNYDGMSNCCGPADLLVEPSAQSRDRVLAWMDGVEMYPNNKELRANGYTPLTFSVETATTELRRIIAADPEAACRPYYLMLLTDGFQQCPGEEDNPAIQAELVAQATELRNLRAGGQTKDVRTFVVGFGRGTVFADGLDAMARAGGTAVNAQGRPDLVNGTAYQADDAAGLADALEAAVGEARPRELCDGVDNDCDDLVDEGFGNLGRPCSVGRGECGRDGVVACSEDGQGTDCSAIPGDPRGEVCNGLDDDCDGQVDEGVLNRCGACGADMPEVCNGMDDDCDGATDEGVLNRCGSCGDAPIEVCNGRDDDCDNRTDEGVQNACGACGDLPSEICNCEDDDCDNRIDEHSANCPRCDCDPQAEACNGVDDDCDRTVDEGTLNACGECGPVPAEICNGLDDDCDGSIDEAFPEAGEPCGVAAGACTAGTSACVDGEVICRGGSQPSAELCDAIDNDCDGQADEGVLNACAYCGPSRVEVCDNIDNDCNGQQDEGTLCRAETDACVNGECAPPCEVGECFGNRTCVRGYCLATCRNTDCPDGQVCQDGECADPCVGIACPEGSYCSLGACEPNDCYGTGCADGERCRGGRCEPDPCATVQCGAGQGCFEGQCFDDCSTLACGDGQRCVNGGCEEDPCARVACGFPQVCVNGACVDDPCFEVDCPVGRMCDQGRCVDDPCLWTECPNGAACHRGECASDGDGRGGSQRVDMGVDAEGGSVTGSSPSSDGCECDASGEGGAPTAWLLALVGLFGVTRRRRRR